MHQVRTATGGLFTVECPYCRALPQQPEECLKAVLTGVQWEPPTPLPPASQSVLVE